MKNILFIGVGGFIGAIMRHYLGILMSLKIERFLQGIGHQLKSSSYNQTVPVKTAVQFVAYLEFPYGAWGTISVNFLGCLVVGMLFEIEFFNKVVSEEMRFLIKVGLIASFTTFSTFAFEILRIYQNHTWGTLFFYACLQIFGGVGMILLGQRIVSWCKMLQV